MTTLLPNSRNVLIPENLEILFAVCILFAKVPRFRRKKHRGKKKSLLSYAPAYPCRVEIPRLISDKELVPDVC